MFLIIGLGNPGKEYEYTRHNVGFRVIDEIAEREGIKKYTKKFYSEVSDFRLGTDKVMILKPETYMNLSGEAVTSAMSYYSLEPSDIIVIYDDISLNVGTIRIRNEGSSGGHNGIKDIIERLGTESFKRIRVGVSGSKEGMNLKTHVLGRFSAEEIPIVEKSITVAADALYDMLQNGSDYSMNKYNGKDLAEER